MSNIFVSKNLTIYKYLIYLLLEISPNMNIKQVGLSRATLEYQVCKMAEIPKLDQYVINYASPDSTCPDLTCPDLSSPNLTYY